MLVALLPVPKGLLAKGPAALLPFLLLEPAANALLIGVATKATRWQFRPAVCGGRNWLTRLT